MYIKQEGTFDLTVISAQVIAHRYNPEDGFEVRIIAENSEKDTATAFLPITNDIIESGKDSGATRAECTFNMLKRIGIGEEGTKLSELDNLIGKTIIFYGKENDKGRINWYVNGLAAKVIPVDKLSKIALMFAPKKIKPKVKKKTTADPNDPNSECPF